MRNFSFLQGALQLYAIPFSMDPTPLAEVVNPFPSYTLINSVDFHPKRNLFCATYTHANQVVLYKISPTNQPEIVQSLNNPSAQLSEPQHAIFSPDGEKIVVANWTNQTLTIYQSEPNGIFCTKPAVLISSPHCLARHKPHGIAFSPCGNLLAIAYGAAESYGRAIALFRLAGDCKLVSLLEEIPGIPKGITFSPDGTSLLVTFSSTNSLVIFNLDRENQTILPIPRQIVRGQETQISRPEDVKISPDGNYCAITNSDQHTVTFYSFDSTSNRVTQNVPIYTLENPEARLCFPHGIAFSSDGSLLLVSEFGPINTTKEGDISWSQTIRPTQAKIKLYTLDLFKGCFRYESGL